MCLVGILVLFNTFTSNISQQQVPERGSSTSVIQRQVPAHGSTTIWAKPIPLFATRDELGILLENEGMKKGVEIGVQRGHYSAKLLSGWKSCEKIYLVDAWKEQENYVDIANVGAGEQEQLYVEARNRMKQWEAKTVFLRMLSSEAVDNFNDEELDFIYVDARHDYCGVRQDIEMYWPKLKEGGIMAGHDYLTAQEVDVLSNGSQDWSICEDGTIHEGAVRGAVDEFAKEHQLQVLMTYQERWPTWILRKPQGTMASK